MVYFRNENGDIITVRKSANSSVSLNENMREVVNANFSVQFFVECMDELCIKGCNSVLTEKMKRLFEEISENKEDFLVREIMISMDDIKRSMMYSEKGDAHQKITFSCEIDDVIFSYDGEIAERGIIAFDCSLTKMLDDDVRFAVDLKNISYDHGFMKENDGDVVQELNFYVEPTDWEESEYHGDINFAIDALTLGEAIFLFYDNLFMDCL
ncbi:hypothetical protein GUI12_00035 [Anaplasmataceae bacterium AB001_6]|nr:hypothetical protein GUI12_00035 [Anaplasmataceae bacterium AB001_6]